MEDKYVALIAGVLLAVLLAVYDKPILKMSCPHCNKKDRNWKLTSGWGVELSWRHGCNHTN